MLRDLLALAAELRRRGEPFALASVVWREPPSSAQPGDTALITGDGTFHGWLGGSCTQPTVRREAQAAIQDGRPRLVELSPRPDPAPRRGVTWLPMTCHSGGHVDIFIEPVLPAPVLLVFGISPTARALARIAPVLGYAVHAVDPDADADAFPDAARVVTDYASPELERARGAQAAAAALVATLGERDEEALQRALSLCDGYVGLISSRKRFAEMREPLVALGVAEGDLARVRCPAGLDLGAVTPEEIALTVMAEITQRRRRESAAAAELAATAPEPPAPAGIVTTDPVCGMTVDAATANHRAEHGGLTYLFCCGGCRQRFLADPSKYLAESSAGGRA